MPRSGTTYESGAETIYALGGIVLGITLLALAIWAIWLGGVLHWIAGLALLGIAQYVLGMGIVWVLLMCLLRRGKH